MKGDTIRTRCSKCNKYLFTEIEDDNVYHKLDDKENYIFDENKEEFICSECAKALELSLIEENFLLKRMEDKYDNTRISS